MPASSAACDDEGDARQRHRSAVGAEHRPEVDRLRRRDRGVRVAHRAAAIMPPLITSEGLTPKKAGFQSTRSASLPGLDRADLVRDALGDRRVDRVLGDVAADAEVVVARFVGASRAPARSFGREPAALRLHLVGRLPGAHDDLADAAHRLAVARHHREHAEVVQHVLGGDRLAPDPALGEREVLGDSRVEVMADHQHVEVLVDRVDGVRHRRVGRRRQHVRAGPRS